MFRQQGAGLPCRRHSRRQAFLKCLLKERSIMSVEAASLSRTVSAMRPMVPAKDFEISKRFYIELGFQPRPLTDRLVEMQLGVFSFILQPYYVREWADNFVVHVTVSDVGLWWDHIMRPRPSGTLWRQDPSAGVARLGSGRRRDRSLRGALEICPNASMTDAITNIAGIEIPSRRASSAIRHDLFLVFGRRLSD